MLPTKSRAGGIVRDARLVRLNVIRSRSCAEMDLKSRSTCIAPAAIRLSVVACDATAMHPKPAPTAARTPEIASSTANRHSGLNLIRLQASRYIEASGFPKSTSSPVTITWKKLQQSQLNQRRARAAAASGQRSPGPKPRHLPLKGRAPCGPRAGQRADIELHLPEYAILTPAEFLEFGSWTIPDEMTQQECHRVCGHRE